MSAPYQPFDFTEPVFHEADLTRLASELEKQPAYQKSGRAAVTIGRDRRMTVVLTALRAGVEIHEHEAPGPATLLVLSGSLSLYAASGPGAAGRRLTAGNAVLFPPEVRHRITGDEDGAFLLIFGGQPAG